MALTYFLHAPSRSQEKVLYGLEQGLHLIRKTDYGLPIRTCPPLPAPKICTAHVRQSSSTGKTCKGGNCLPLLFHLRQLLCTTSLQPSLFLFFASCLYLCPSLTLPRKCPFHFLFKKYFFFSVLITSAIHTCSLELT